MSTTNSGASSMYAVPLPSSAFSASCPPVPATFRLLPSIVHPSIPGVHATSTPIGYTVGERPRRTRRSTIPPEQREQTRRLKKQNMERRRRACISDKMNALHNLAMEIVGVEPRTQQKVEKADILNTCFKVIDGIAKIAREKPEIRARLQQIRYQLPDLTSHTPPTDDTTQGSTFSDDLSIDILDHDVKVEEETQQDKENQVPRTSQTRLASNRTAAAHGRTTGSLLFPNASCSDSGVHSLHDDPHTSKFEEVHRKSLCLPNSSIPPFRSPSKHMSCVPDTQATIGSYPRHVLTPRQFPHDMLPTPEPTSQFATKHKPMGLTTSSNSAFRQVNSERSTAVWRPYL